jgi:membrane protease YdiL (CAAX protease family)
MLVNFSNTILSRGRNVPIVVGLAAWVFVGFAAASVIMSGLVVILQNMGVSLVSINGTVLNFIFAALVYVLTLAIVIGLPWLVKKHRTTASDIGTTRWPSYMDILLSLAGIVIYFIISSILSNVIQYLVPSLDFNQAQETGFAGINQRYEYMLAFLTLVVIAPVAEEILFRGYLYGKLRKHVPVWAAALITSALFGAVHGQWNVAIDVFALSLVLCSLREVTGNIWAGMLVHMLKNSVAFYFLFINTSLLDTIVK